MITPPPSPVGPQFLSRSSHGTDIFHHRTSMFATQLIHTVNVRFFCSSPSIVSFYSYIASAVWPVATISHSAERPSSCFLSNLSIFPSPSSSLLSQPTLFSERSAGLHTAKLCYTGEVHHLCSTVGLSLSRYTISISLAPGFPSGWAASHLFFQGLLPNLQLCSSPTFKAPDVHHVSRGENTWNDLVACFVFVLELQYYWCRVTWPHLMYTCIHAVYHVTRSGQRLLT